MHRPPHPGPTEDDKESERVGGWGPCRQAWDTMGVGGGQKGSLLCPRVEETQGFHGG